MKIASAQIDCEVGAIQQNLEKHVKLIELAINNGVEFIVFPEMSITGYCREEGKKNGFERTDLRISRLRDLSSTGNITIVAGAPIWLNNKLYIGSYVIRPNRTIDIYTKQCLHDGEELFYSSSKEYDPIVKIGNEHIALAICADISSSAHPKSARKNGATIYAPSIFYSAEGMEKGNNSLEKYSKELQLNIIMSNYCGRHWNMEAGGKSGFWNARGNKLGELSNQSSGLVLAEKIHGEWNVKTIEPGKNRSQHAG